jgi:dodecin
LADLFTLLFAANPFSAVRASLRRWSSDEFEDGLAHGGQCQSPSARLSTGRCLRPEAIYSACVWGERVQFSLERIDPMAVKQSDSVYRIVDVVGVSEKSWEDAGRQAVETAASSLRDLRVAEVTKMDMKVENGKVTAFRTRVALSFKYET